MEDELSLEEKQTLLYMAREAMEYRVRGKKLPPLSENQLSSHLRDQGASFVTLTIGGSLRGCIGALEAYQPLADDVREHAIAAALEDPRFPPVREDELSRINIEVSRLTCPLPLEYKDAAELLSKIRPHLDGIILRDEYGHRATFLPQVWEKISDPSDFFDNLCYKMGIAPNTWRTKHLQVLTYQVEEFCEPV